MCISVIVFIAFLVVKGEFFPEALSKVDSEGRLQS